MKLAPVNIKNKRATFDYELTDTYTAGIVLTGTEIKSIRLGKASLVDTFCFFSNGELWVKNMHIAEYKAANRKNHKPKRERKLLLHKKEINKLIGQIKTAGITVVPLSVYFNDKGFAKTKIAIVKGKKLYDKRATIKQREWDREKSRLSKNNL